MTTSKSSNPKTPIWIIILLTIAIVSGLWIANYLFFVDDVDRGTLGDMFGVVNSLFSGLAFAGIILTIYLQRTELALQRKELELTRNEFVTQNSTLRLQRFENTFFNMLSLHHEIVNGIDLSREEIADKNDYSLDRIKTKTVTYRGRDVFKIRYDSILRKLKKEELKNINDVYMNSYWSFASDYDHYFMNLYRIIKLVDTTKLTSSVDNSEEFREKYKYTSMVRAQISTYELVWLFYNCLSENGNKRFKPLIEKYSLFKNLRFDELANQNHKNFYERSAFKKPE